MTFLYDMHDMHDWTLSGTWVVLDVSGFLVLIIDRFTSRLSLLRLRLVLQKYLCVVKLFTICHDRNITFYVFYCILLYCNEIQ